MKNQLLLVSFLVVGGHSSQGAIQVLAGGTLESFPAQPAAANWSTVALAGAAGTVTNDATMDAAVAPLIAANITAQLAINNAAQGTSALARWNQPAAAIESAPTNNAGNVIMATLNNASGGQIDALGVSYSLGVANAGGATMEDAIVGHRVLWSLTGGANSWTPAGTFGYLGPAASPQTQGFVINTPWPAGTSMFIIWADDNSTPNPDNLHSIDDVRFSVVPEPGAALLGLGVVLGGWFRRRVRR